MSWAFVSDPGGDGFGGSGSSGGGVIWISYDGGSAQSSAAGSTDPRWVQQTGYRGAARATAWLLVAGEVALIEQAGATELRCPLLADPVIRLAGATPTALQGGAAAVQLTLREAADLDPAAGIGPGRLLIAERDTLLALEHSAGVIAWGRDGKQLFGPGATLRDDPDRLRVVTADARVTTLIPAPAPPADRRLRRPQPGQIELIGPQGTTLARVPEAAVTLRGGVAGLFLSADFPSGLPGDSRPFGLTAATANRYLLRLQF